MKGFLAFVLAAALVAAVVVGGLALYEWQNWTLGADTPRFGGGVP